MNKWYLVPVAIILSIGIYIYYDEYVVDPNALVWYANEELDGHVYAVILQTDHGLACKVSSGNASFEMLVGSSYNFDTQEIALIKIYPRLNLATYRIVE